MTAVAAPHPNCGDRPGGAATAVIDVRRVGAHSVVTHAFASSPVKLLMPRNHGHAAWIYLATYGGGLVDGDAIAVALSIGPDAAALVSTQASTKVFPSPRGTQMAMTARVAAGGVLVVLPDPVVSFAGARYRQDQTFALDRGATLVLLDWMSSGRRARGERWAFDEYESRVSVRVDGRLVIYDALALRRRDGALAARFGRFDVLATAVLIGPVAADGAAAVVQTSAERTVARHPAQLVSAAPVDGGAIVRVAGPSVEDVGQTMRAALACLPRLLGDDPWARKW